MDRIFLIAVIIAILIFLIKNIKIIKKNEIVLFYEKDKLVSVKTSGIISRFNYRDNLMYNNGFVYKKKKSTIILDSSKINFFRCYLKITASNKNIFQVDLLVTFKITQQLYFIEYFGNIYDGFYRKIIEDIQREAGNYKIGKLDTLSSEIIREVNSIYGIRGIETLKIHYLNVDYIGKMR